MTEAPPPHGIEPPGSRPVAAADDEISMLELVNVLLRRWKLVLGLPVLAGLVAAVISLLLPPTFTATTQFVPELSPQSRLPSGLAGLAGQFGVSLGGEGGESPQFYAQVLRSHEIMNRVLLRRYPNPRSAHNSPDSATLLAILAVEGDSLADSLHNGRKRLDDLLSVRVDNQTSIVTLGVDSHYPTLAAHVANRFIEYLNEFNTKTRQSQARERRRFVEQRLLEADQDLERAEDAIRQFYERNRTWEGSPQLRSEQERLQRQVQLRLDVALTLRREYETARIGEVNDTPVITVIHAASPPQEKAKPKRALLVVVWSMAAGLAGVFGSFTLAFIDRAKEYDRSAYDELRAALAGISTDLRRLVRR